MALQQLMQLKSIIIREGEDFK